MSALDPLEEVRLAALRADPDPDRGSRHAADGEKSLPPVSRVGVVFDAGLKGPERDRSIVVDLTRYGALTAELLRRWYFGGALVTVWNRMAVLIKREYVRPWRPRWRGETAYLPTPAGCRWAQTELPPPRIGSGRTMGHLLTTAGAAWWCLSDAPSGSAWLTDRELQRSERGRRPAGARAWQEAWAARRRGEWAPVPAPTPGAAAPAVPDGCLLLPDGDRIAVEVETSPRSRPDAYEAKLAWYASPAGQRAYAEVRYLVAPALPAVMRLLQRRIEHARAASRIRVQVLPPSVPIHQGWG